MKSLLLCFVVLFSLSLAAVLPIIDQASVPDQKETPTEWSFARVGTRSVTKVQSFTSTQSANLFSVVIRNSSFFSKSETLHTVIDPPSTHHELDAGAVKNVLTNVVIYILQTASEKHLMPIGFSSTITVLDGRAQWYQFFFGKNGGFDGEELALVEGEEYYIGLTVTGDTPVKWSYSDELEFSSPAYHARLFDAPKGGSTFNLKKEYTKGVFFFQELYEGTATDDTADADVDADNTDADNSDNTDGSAPTCETVEENPNEYSKTAIACCSCYADSKNWCDKGSNSKCTDIGNPCDMEGGTVVDEDDCPSLTDPGPCENTDSYSTRGKQCCACYGPDNGDVFCTFNGEDGCVDGSECPGDASITDKQDCGELEDPTGPCDDTSSFSERGKQCCACYGPDNGDVFCTSNGEDGCVDDCPGEATVTDEDNCGQLQDPPGPCDDTDSFSERGKACCACYGKDNGDVFCTNGNVASDKCVAPDDCGAGGQSTSVSEENCNALVDPSDPCDNSDTFGPKGKACCACTSSEVYCQYPGDLLAPSCKDPLECATGTGTGTGKSGCEALDGNDNSREGKRRM